MNLMIRILFSLLSLRGSYGVIYHLNASEYQRMPPIYKLDSYSSCLQEPSDVYCTLNFQLVSDEPNELLHMIEEYSEHSKTHFDHKKLRYGICVTKNCQNYIQNKISVSETILEECLNQSFSENYQLKTRIQDYSCYNLSDNEIKKDTGDVIAGMIILAIIVLNLIGSLYDVWCTSNKYEGKSILLLFSIQRNWNRLISSTRSNDPRLESLKGINGIRCILSYLEILLHSGIPFFMMTGNTHDLELCYHKIIEKILFNGPILIQSYFVISGFLLTYKMELNSEKRPINWSTVPKEILNRYIRLTPAYALVILLLATWFKYLGPGPLWKIRGEADIMNCQEHWWLNLLYVNNYVYNFQCLLTFWYLGADMQLFCCGLILYVLLRKNKFKKSILISLIVIGSVISAIHTYVRDLDFGVLCTPSALSEMFEKDPTFNETYKMGHANISSYVIGMSLGYLVYKWQNKKTDYRKYWVFRFIYWSILPLFCGVMLSGAIFYRDTPREPLYMRVLFSAFAKPIVGTLTAILLAEIILKSENVNRSFLEWDLWIIPSRLTYGVYLLHFAYIHVYINLLTSLLQYNILNMIVSSICLTIASFITAIPLFLLVEAPFAELVKHFTETPKKEAIINFKKTE